MTQAQLADAVDCTQSAVSMFENGRTDVLSKEKVAAIEQVLNIILPATASAPEQRQTILKHCPNFECPSGTPYTVGPHLCCRPTLVEVSAGTRYCTWCGELLVDACNNPECRKPLTQGSFCPDCGTPYVMLPSGWTPPPDWIAGRHRLREQLLPTHSTLTHSPRSGA